MPTFHMRYPGGRSKAVTFSYDDGVVQDIRLSQIFDKYGLKGTFNINRTTDTTKEEYLRLYVKQIGPNCWQGRYTPTIDGKRVSRNVYAPTEEECEKKLKELIINIKEEIKATKQSIVLSMI